MDFTFQREALKASGVKQNLMLTYTTKLLRLHEESQLHVPASKDPVLKARALFDWLWARRSHRYKRKGTYKLHEVIDSELNIENGYRANCLGLTVFYHCLLVYEGIKPEAVYLEDAFGYGPHVFTLLRYAGRTTDVENIFADGFDYQGHLGNSNRIIWKEKELVADIYESLGTELFLLGEHRRAQEQYEQALKLNPNYEKAHINRNVVLHINH